MNNFPNFEHFKIYLEDERDVEITSIIKSCVEQTLYEIIKILNGKWKNNEVKEKAPQSPKKKLLEL